jgi:enoyl-CoA hydratase/carnithine racemase
LVDLKREGEVFILTMNSGENRFNPSFVEAMHQALDLIEQSSGPAALVTIGGNEKYYSNGLDLTWFREAGEGEQREFTVKTQRFLGRIMGFPIPTVAAMNGHTFAGGAMLALAHDFRVMRADRGFFCLPAVDLKIALPQGMISLIHSRLSPSVFRDLMLTGKRIGGLEAHKQGVVDQAVPGDRVLTEAISLAAGLAGKDRQSYGTLKRGMFAEILDLLSRGRI